MHWEGFQWLPLGNSITQKCVLPILALITYSYQGVFSNKESIVPDTLLVTGAAGQLGRRVIDLLLEAGETKIIAATRTPAKLADLAARGVEVRAADFDAPESLPAAFAGADRLLLISTDAVDYPGHRIAQQTAAAKAAATAHVRHVVYTSIVNPTPQNPSFVVPDHSATEAALEASEMGYTSLRNNLYMDLLLGTVAQAVQLGTLYSAAGDGKAAYVTREDCARVAAAALTAPFEGRRTVDITGPAAISHADVAALASQISGKQIPYVALPVDVLVQNMVAAGLPEFVAAAYATFDVAIAQGQLEKVSDGVEVLTGRSPIAAADFLAQNWKAQQPTA
jgi:NAD(P)H dehydrogenase (quinone)